MVEPVTTEIGGLGDGALPPGAPRLLLDVRPQLAAGEEPFATIMQAAARLGDGEVLVLRSPFDPTPLHAVLARKGFLRSTRELAAGDFETSYWQGPSGDPEEGERQDPPETGQPPTGMRVLDVRGLLPPEPLERTLAALEALPAGEALVQVNERVPIFLLPELEERGYTYRLGHDDRGVLVTMWREARP